METLDKDVPIDLNQKMERRTIDMVPLNERHGNAFSQFSLWLGANLQVTTVVTGALAIIFGDEALSAIIALLIGNILGGAVMALHSAQGPRLGLPQMISSRVQFGVKGASLPLILAIIMYLGFAATGTVLSGKAINHLLGFQTPEVGMIIFGVLTTFFAILGYRFIHVMGRVASVVGIIGFAYLAIRIFTHYDVSSFFGQKPFSWSMFLLSMSLSAGWQLTYAPYVADYSRYLPETTSVKSSFWATFGGTVIGTQLSMMLGVLVAAASNGSIKDIVGYLGELAGPMAIVIYMVIIVGKVTVNCLNAYGGFMSILTTVSAFSNKTKISQTARSFYIIGFVGLSILIAIAASADFLNNFKHFVLLLLSVFTPWSAVNLIDYYLVSKERVDIPALYDVNGRYGAYNQVALWCYVLGVVVQIPFLAADLYTGYFTKLLGGADISWVVSLVVTGLVYYPLAKRTMNVPDKMIYPSTR